MPASDSVLPSPHPPVAPLAPPRSRPVDPSGGQPEALGELDLALIEALQLQPRASWARIGSVIGVDATTAARRWRRLNAEGLAWMTAYPARHASVVAYVDVACDAGALDALTRLLTSWAPVFSAERTTGEHQLFLGVAARDLSALDDFASRRLGGLPGVRSVRAEVCTRVYREGSGWLVHALGGRQRSHLADRESQGGRRHRAGPFESDRDLLLALGADARRSHAELARDCGLSDTTVRRRLRRMIGNEEVYFRCDVTQRLAGWPVVATFRVAAPSSGTDAVARSLAGLPETRLCSSVTGSDNLLLSVWLRSPGDAPALEERVLRRHPELRIGERSITLYTAKRMGRLLDRWGRATGHVPITAAPEAVRWGR
ncbi:Lrp/AsnC family transcriptional regulator [Strepomyces sp. STD 3.1]|uniref:Lrp/AsnC family transcriptional regulator n=1 Tax=Streptomyces sp. NPDC058985 TaxID=3346684 RepID=UPI001F444020|nr:Lrp/AsnC family transcriptional regulator [Streptomyces sp. STD 3.1]